MYGMRAENPVTGSAFTPPKWRQPAPLSYGHAIDSVGTVGSSLLAGFSVASVIVVTSEASAFRWPGAAVLALAGLPPDAPGPDAPAPPGG
jgi:hypothetical protein